MRRVRAISLAAAKKLVAALLPRGRVWGSATPLADAAAAEVERFYGRGAALLLEQHGRTADETLAAWEREYGLPICGTSPESPDDRRAAVAAAVAASGGQSVAYFVAVARAAGAEVTIEEGPTAPYAVPECGVLECGLGLEGPYARRVWRVTFALGTTLAADALVRCLFERYKPAHTMIEWRIGPAPSGYLACNGTVWAEAVGAMTAVSGVWSRVVVCYVGAAAQTTLAGTDKYLAIAASSGTVSAQVELVSEGGVGFGAVVTPTAELVAAALTPGETSTLRSVWAVSDGVETEGPYAGDVAVVDPDIWLARSGPAGTDTIAATGTSIYADLVIQGTPTVAELRALLTTPPWQVFAPSTILRCYLPALATVDFPDVIIPDVAQLVGGPLAPVNAVMQAGGLDDIVSI